MSEEKEKPDQEIADEAVIDNLDPLEEEKVEEEIPVLEPKPEDEEELKARARGWDPTKGDKTAREFNLIGDLIEQKKVINKLEKNTEEIIKYHQEISKQQKANFRAQLDANLKYAEETGDIEAVKKLTVDKVTIDQQEQQEKRVQETATSNKVANEFIQRNQAWYNDQHPELKARTFEVEQYLLAQQRYTSYEDLAQAIEHQMRAELSVNPNYSHLLQLGKPIPRPNVINSPTATSVAKSEADKGSYSKLNSYEKAEYNALNKMNAKSGIPVMTVNDFVKHMEYERQI